MTAHGGKGKQTKWGTKKMSHLPWGGGMVRKRGRVWWRTKALGLELVLGTEAAGGALWTQSLDPEHVRGGRGEVTDHHKAFVQDQHCVHGHVPVFILQRAQ